MILEQLLQYRQRPREVKATERLSHPEAYPGLAPWKEHETQVRFIELPSFRPYSVWTLQVQGTAARVRRIEWDHVTDVRLWDAFPDAEPTTYGADAQLPFEDARQVLDELASIRMPPFLPVHTLGIDGVTCAIEFGNHWRSATLSWWGNPPDEWHQMVHSYRSAIMLFERFLPASTARNRQ